MKLILAQCPKCKSRFKVVAEKVAGKKLRCASCRQAFRIPATAAAGSASGSKRKPRAVESDEVEVIEDFGGEVELLDDFEETDFPVDEFDEFEIEPLEEFAPPARSLPARVSSKPARRVSEEPAEKDEKEAGSAKTIALIAGVSLIGLSIVGGLIFLGTKGSISFASKVEAPSEFEQFRPEVGKFNCQYPKGWEVESGGGTGGAPAWARFTKGSNVISLRIAGGSAQALGMGGHQVDPNKVPFELAPVHTVHVEQQWIVEDEYADYVEKPPQRIDVKHYGDARVSEFIARDKLWRSKVAGLRVTTINVDVLNVMCRCPEKDFETLRPAFETVIKSINVQ